MSEATDHAEAYFAGDYEPPDPPDPPQRAHVLLVDLGSVFYPAWHAVPASEPAGTACDVAVARVRRLAEGTRSHVAVCADGPNNWRYALASDYKANRESKTEACIAQLKRCAETLRLDGFPIWLVNGYEADDIIATATRLASTRELLVSIATADKDLLQLVRDGGVTVRSLKTGAELGERDVAEKYGVRPEQIGDWLALVGDTADNVRGVPGIGPKRATDLLRQFGTLAGIMVAAEDPTDERMLPKQRASLLEHAEQLALSRRLVALRTDADVDFDEALRERVASPLQGTERDLEGETMSTNENEIQDAQVEEVPRAAASKPRQAVAQDVTVEPMAAAHQPAQVAPSHALTIIRPGSDEWSLALEPMSSAEAWKIAGHLMNSRLFGGFVNQAGLFAGVMFARSLGMPAVAVRNIHVVEGRMTLSAQTIIGLVLKSGKADFFKCVETTTKTSTFKTHRKGDPDPESSLITWTIEDARTAGLVKPNGNWEKYPAQMLRWSAAKDLARMVYPDIVAGLYSPDELDGEHASIAVEVQS